MASSLSPVPRRATEWITSTADAEIVAGEKTLRRSRPEVETPNNSENAIDEDSTWSEESQTQYH